ncbi:MAG: hypothetical protein KAH57_02325 [Thermoplasmata archaeon]|nr:hypothetical protein [Thermoplasmata archaeon]
MKREHFPIISRFSPKDIDLIDEVVERGYFTNRSDAIRNSLRTHLRGFEVDEKPERDHRPFKTVTHRRGGGEKKIELHERILMDMFEKD